MTNMVFRMSDFVKGLITGCIATLIICGVIFALVFFQRRDKELVEYAEKRMAIEDLREDYINRDPVEFFEIPGVRGAADGATADFERKRDEAVQRFRSGLADR